jgi:hypothetical protein
MYIPIPFALSVLRSLRVVGCIEGFSFYFLIIRFDEIKLDQIPFDTFSCVRTAENTQGEREWEHDIKLEGKNSEGMEIK